MGRNIGFLKNDQLEIKVMKTNNKGKEMGINAMESYKEKCLVLHSIENNGECIDYSDLH